MEIDTKPYGKLTIEEKQLIEFPYGIPGFDTMTKFALLDSRQPNFYWLQSLEKTELAFILVDPQMFRPDYFLNLSQFDLESIEISEADPDMLIFAIVTVQKEGNMTANLAGPVVINRANHKARQMINNDMAWQVRHDIKEEMKNKKDTVETGSVEEQVQE